MAIACIIFAGSLCFVQKHKTLDFLLRICLLISLICLGFTCANYKNNFSGYSILLILSVIPMFLSLFDLEGYLAEKHAKFAKNEQIEEKDNTKTTNNESTNTIFDASHTKNYHIDTKKLKDYFVNSTGLLLISVSFLLPAICIGFAGLYIGKESPYGFLIGLALAFAGLFLLKIIKKQINLFDLLGYFLVFLAIGICLGQIIAVIIYAQAPTNILYCVGTLIFCIYVGLSVFAKSKYDHIAYLVATVMLFLTFIL